MLILSLLMSGCNQPESDESAPIVTKKPVNKHRRITAAGASNGSTTVSSEGISEGISAGQTTSIVSGTNLKGAFAGVFSPWKYTRALQERIANKWQMPPGASTKSGIVAFVIDHTGSISELVVKKSSGATDYDQSMLQAVEHAVPLPPLVASAPPKLKVEFTFDERLAHGVASQEDWKKIATEQGLALEKDPMDFQALTRRGRARLHLGDIEKALQDYKAVIIGSENNVHAYLERAKCYLYIDNYKAALLDCQQCQRLAPEMAKGYTLAAAAQLGLGHLQEAFKSLDRAIELSPNDAETWALKANADNLAIKHKDALVDAGKAIEIDPEYGSAYAYRGDACEALKDYDGALRDYSKNVELDAFESQAYIRRAELYSTLGQYDKAVIDATEAIHLAPKNAEGYYYRAHANEELGLKAQAQKDLARAKQLGI
ncbi:MAG: TonB family protein [Cyanobacteria bacterium REEB67]|nr:TonB family protein [Cyanobacteria bacterium REEB67]